MRKNGRNITIKPIRNKNARRKEKLHVLGKVGSGHNKTETKEKVKKTT